MTRPMGEMSPAQRANESRYAIRQLQRRPDPTSGGLKWAVATKYSASVSKSGGYYRARFDDITTNDTALFELAGISGGGADWLQINSAGYFLAKFSLVTSGASDWGANYTVIQPIYAYSGTTDVNMDTAVSNPDWDESFSRRAEKAAADSGHRGLARDMTFQWDGGLSSGDNDLSYENPLKIGVRAQSDQTAAVSFVAQLFVVQLTTSASFTATSA